MGEGEKGDKVAGRREGERRGRKGMKRRRRRKKEI